MRRFTWRCHSFNSRFLQPGRHRCKSLGKLLVVAPDQHNARRYAETLRGWIPDKQAATVQLATCDERDAHQTLARFRSMAEPSFWSRWR